MNKRNLILPAALFALAFALCSIPANAQSHNSHRDFSFAAQAGGQASPAPESPATQTESPESQPQQTVTAYTLPPALYEKAHHLGEVRFRLALVDFVYGLIVLWVILRLKLGPKYRDWAEKAASNRFLQAVIFAPLLILTMDILGLPADIYENSLDRAYGLSVQGWGSWAWDWTKSEFLSVLGGIILVYLLYAVIRKSPRRWWFYFWLVSLPLGLLLVFAQPVVIDPMFHKFEPLEQKDPALVASLEKMVHRAGQDIPPDRMFWMAASEKSTELNAYVTGFGASKRIVVWDNTIAKMNAPQIVFVAGHETGHYVLHHIPKGIALGAIYFLIVFYAGYRLMGWVLARRGQKWEIRAIDDWASLPVLLLLLSILSFITNPVTGAASRYFEHQADQYGLEVTHGLTPDSGEVAAQAFEILGQVDLSDPKPNPLDVWLFYSHPTLAERIRFALSYDPWANGGHGEFVH
ncbi:MAG TPA: M48 family metallopeptidase [Candidatus Acidoferrales bacterium]|jgi:Zn-dependent protease with chaperone function|nr:M48 family metallopeptidase [Candidatus Acidoferrales bacterium]